MRVDRTDIEQMDERFRANFINGLSGYKSANLVGTADGQGRSNLAIVSSAVHLGAHPPLMGYINRPHTVTRDSLENILQTRCYTFNQVHQDMVASAHQTSARYDKSESEFSACDLTEQWLDDFAAPLVKESAIKIGLRYLEHHTLLNQTVMVIGEVVFVEVPDQVVQGDGSLDVSQAGTVATGGLDTYYSAKKLVRLSYAKVGKPPHPI